MKISDMSPKQKAVLRKQLERDCEWRAEYIGNVGPACLRCPSCQRHLDAATKEEPYNPADDPSVPLERISPDAAAKGEP